MNEPAAQAVLYYVHDPMCSWCWGFEPVRNELMHSLPEGVDGHRLLGGLAPDSDAPMPEEMRGYLEKTWRRIQQKIPGTRFNFDFWARCAPRRSTWPACRAVIAAREQGSSERERHSLDRRMTGAIQRAYYLEARNPSDAETLIELATEIGLAPDRFHAALLDPDTQSQLEREMALGRTLGATSFPSLVLTRDEAQRTVPVDYTNVAPMLKAIEDAI